MNQSQSNRRSFQNPASAITQSRGLGIAADDSSNKRKVEGHRLFTSAFWKEKTATSPTDMTAFSSYLPQAETCNGRREFSDNLSGSALFSPGVLAVENQRNI